ncbi:MAG TPA: DinB family protein [Acidobacteriota bacterium]|nr:DinB family protein [Acidobacteriota bacterium]
MFRKVSDFLGAWTYESDQTQKMLDRLTDASLKHAVGKGHRTIGRVAWHIVVTIPEMGQQVGLKIAGADPKAAVPETAAAIAKAYREAAASLGEQVKANWDDATLEKTDDMYGETWMRGQTLAAVSSHQTHHRGQLSVLMRQAGLAPVGPYGPAKEEWEKYNAPAPEV